MLTLVVQESRRLYREGLVLFLDGEPDLQVVGAAETYAEVVSLCERHRPDAIVFEIDADGWAGLRLAAALRKKQRALRVVGLHTSTDRAQLHRAYQAGVHALVPRDAGAEPIVRALRSASRASAASPRVRTAEPAPRAGGLTARELDVLRLVGAGATTREISARLGISPKTVENHKQRIFTKLGVQNQAHAVAIAMRSGLLRPIDIEAG